MKYIRTTIRERETERRRQTDTQRERARERETHTAHAGIPAYLDDGSRAPHDQVAWVDAHAMMN